jgi:4-hydroxythreonine-4-phosphate dehydrogenase
VIRLTALQWLDEQHADLRRSTLDSARHALCNGRHLVLAVAGEVVQPFTRALVEAIAAAVAPLLQDAATCVLTGGDTARAMFNQLGIQRLAVVGEVEPGISIASATSHPAIRFILKAGGFGEPPALQRIIRQFGRPSPARPAAHT